MTLITRLRLAAVMMVESRAMPDREMFDRMKGEIVAFVAKRHGEHYAYIKRVGSAIGASGPRLFETVGTSGDALAVLCPNGRGEPDESSELVLERMWQVHGVLRNPR